MAKKFPPNKDMIGDVTRTEGTASGISGAGPGKTFRQPSESSVEMYERRGANPNIKREKESFQELLKRQKEEKNNPDGTPSPAAPSKPESKNESPSSRAIQQKMAEQTNQKESPKKEVEISKEQKPEKNKSHGI